MPATTPAARPDGGEVPDLLALRLAHRVQLRDAARLTDLAERIAAGGPVDRARAAAVGAYVRDWADSVDAQGAAEDELLLPLLVASAGRHVDVSELHRDHAALADLLHRLRAVTRAFEARPDEDTATALAVELTDVRSALAEHVREEEALVVPVAQRYVTVRAWERAERQVRRRTRLVPELARLRSAATAQEWRVLRSRTGRLRRVALVVLGPAHRRRERAVFGATGRGS